MGGPGPPIRQIARRPHLAAHGVLNPLGRHIGQPAGHDVAAVEVSEAMVERGRKKGGGVRWIHSDMRSV